jgi:capsular polysaccharide biosynthesis protein
MTENPQISNNLPDDEIRFIDILGFLVLNKNLILSIISFFTLSSVIYCFSATPIYKASIIFMPSQEFHITEPIVRTRLSQIKQSIYKQFVDLMKSPDLQQKVATEGGFLEKLKDGPNDTTDTARLLSRVNSSISAVNLEWTLEPHIYGESILEMTGKDPKVISEFLKALYEAGIKTVQNKTFKLIQEAGFKALQDLEEKKQVLEEKKLKLPIKLAIKLAQEKFIRDQKILDDQFININIIEQEIKILRKQAKAIRLRKIKILEDHLKIAENFTAIERNVRPLDPFNDFAFSNGEIQNQTLITLLKKRTNDDLFTPNIIKLQELLKAYKNNQISHRPSEKTSFKLPLRYLKSEAEIKQSEDLKRNLKKIEDLKRFKSKISFELKTKQSEDLKRNLKKIEDLKRNLKISPEVIITIRKNFLPQEPSAPEKTKIITCAIVIGLFFGIFIALLRSGLRILKKKV